MNNKIKTKYKELIIELIDGDDWTGVRNLVDIIITNAAPASPIQAPPVVEQVQLPEPPPATDFDNERAARMAAKNR